MRHYCLAPCVILFITVLWCQLGIYIWSSTRCSYPTTEESSLPTATSSKQKVMIVSDVHILGNRRRSWLERHWVDFQVTMSFRINVRRFKPDVLLLLGDQFDEGNWPTPPVHWEEYVSRFKKILPHEQEFRHMIVHVGNHDAGFGHQMLRSALARHEKAFGKSNQIHVVNNVTWVQLNTMVLVDNNKDASIKQEVLDFIEEVGKMKTTGPVILLVHFPLYRPDDRNCGAERATEGGHVTYEAPSFEYEVGHHVLSENMTLHILNTIQPNFVFSGHTHAICRYVHPNFDIPEFTVPAFAWGQRPDPSFALASVNDRDVQVSLCRLPVEYTVFIIYGTSVLLCIILGIVLKYREKKRTMVVGKRD